jgi:ribosomal protein S27E
MALFNFVCPKCGTKKRRICSPEEAKQPISCKQCSTTLERDPTGPTQQVKERIDNTLMPRAVERLSEAERLYKERAEKFKNDG